MTRLFVLLILLTFIYKSKAQNMVTIPDTNFASHLQTIIPGAMTGNQMDTTSTLVTSMQSLSVMGKNISNLYGLQFFSSLAFLDCNSNILNALPTLPASLKFINCGGNPLVSLPNNLNSLDTLICGGCYLTSLPTLPNNMTYLDCNGNSLSTLPSLPNSLLHLDCFSNPLGALPPLPANIIELRCNNNNLSALPPLPNSLEILYCNGNSLTSLPTLPPSLQFLWCQYNSLSTIPALPSTLKNFWCHNNLLTTLPQLPDSLQWLVCYNNNIACFPVFPNTIWNGNFTALPNPCNCYPNQINAMLGTTQILPVCLPNNTDTCSVAPGCIAGLSFTLTPNAMPQTWDIYINYPPGILDANWDWGDTTSSNSFYPSHTYINAGWYNICLTVLDSNFCSTIYCETDSLYKTNNTMVTLNVISGAVGINHSLNESTQTTIIPNPASNKLRITKSSSNIQFLCILDISGNEMFSTFITTSIDLDITSLNNGIYTVLLKDNNQIEVKRLVIAR